MFCVKLPGAIKLKDEDLGCIGWAKKGLRFGVYTGKRVRGSGFFA